MEAESFDLSKWVYSEVEYIPRDYAASIGADYDAGQPLGFIGEGAGRRALEGLGLTVKQIYPYSGFAYKTVSGWFRAGRRPSGPTFCSGIFPVLCEAYVRLHEQDPRHRAPRDAYLGGAAMDDGYRLDVERKIATLLCTGLLLTEEERARERERDREAYHRAVMRFAAAYLDGGELRPAAEVILAVLNAHAARPARATGPDRLDDIMGRSRWYWHADRREDLETLFAGAGPEQSSLFVEAGMHICTTLIEELAVDGYIERLGDEDLLSLHDRICMAMLARGLA